MRVLQISLILLSLAACLQPEEVRRIEHTVDALDTLGLELPSLAELPGMGPRPGSTCDLSFSGPQPCGYTMWCDPGDKGLQKMGDGRLGVLGVCRDRGMPGEACSADAHCLGPFHCGKVNDALKCVDPTPLALLEPPPGRVSKEDALP